MEKLYKIYIFFVIWYIQIHASNAICQKHITNYNICVQSAQANWRELFKPRDYCCLLLDVRECRRLLRFATCEALSVNHTVTSLIHDQLRQEISKLLFIGDVCANYRKRSTCAGDFWAFSMLFVILIIGATCVAYAYSKYQRLKDDADRGQRLASIVAASRGIVLRA